jgi:hypothetical protein
MRGLLRKDAEGRSTSLALDYSCAGICCSLSRQALIFKRRQTQQSCSGSSEDVSAPHTVHFRVFFNWSFDKERLAFSRISAGTTGSDLACVFRLILCTPSIPETDSEHNPVKALIYAASRNCTTSPASSADAHRGHFCPGTTSGFLPAKPASASTVWVQIGQ